MREGSRSVPFTYLIGWSKTNTFYYGVRYASGIGPESLWETYFTSSNYVKRYRQEHGEPDIIQIRKTFKTKRLAVLWEHKVLRRLRVLKRDDFLNKSLSDGKGFFRQVGCKGHPHTAEHKKYMSEHLKGRIYKPESIERMRDAAKLRKHTEETKAKMSATRLAKKSKHTEETKAKMRAYHSIKNTSSSSFEM